MNIRRMCQNLEQFNNRVSFKIWQVFFTVRVIQGCKMKNAQWWFNFKKS